MSAQESGSFCLYSWKQNEQGDSRYNSSELCPLPSLFIQRGLSGRNPLCQTGVTRKDKIKHFKGKEQTLFLRLVQKPPIKHNGPINRFPILNKHNISRKNTSTFNHSKDILWHSLMQWKITSKSNLTAGNYIKITSYFHWTVYYVNLILSTRRKC